MKFGFRTPSLKKRIAARTSWKRYTTHSLGIKVPKGMSFLTNPKKASYNKIYNLTSFGANGVSAKKSNSSSGAFDATKLQDIKSKNTGCGGCLAIIFILFTIIIFCFNT